MALPNTPYAANTTPQMINLDQTFAAVAALGTVPCTATGTNALTLTPGANTPTISVYVDFLKFTFAAPATSSGLVTVQVGSLAALKLFVSGGVAQATAGDLNIGVLYEIAYQSTLDSGAGGFVVLNAISAAGLALATNSQAAAGTSIAVAMTPASMRFYPGVAEAYVVFAGNSGVGSAGPLLKSFNVSTVNKDSSGVFTITFTSGFSDAFYVSNGSVCMGPGSPTTIGRITAPYSQNQQACTVFVSNPTALENSAGTVMYAFYGTRP